MSPMMERYQLHFAALAPVTSKEQNRTYRKALLELETRSHLAAEQQQYAHHLAALIEQYERAKYPDADVSPTDVIRELMEANGLRQRDLAGILGGGHESVVSEILNEKRPLSRAHIEKLSQRFLVSPAVFFPPLKSRTARHAKEHTAEG